MVSETPRIYAMCLKGFSEFLGRLLETEPIPNLFGLPHLKCEKFPPFFYLSIEPLLTDFQRTKGLIPLLRTFSAACLNIFNADVRDSIEFRTTTQGYAVSSPSVPACQQEYGPLFASRLVLCFRFGHFRERRLLRNSRRFSTFLPTLL